jgi:hypothetical protein
MRRFMLAAALGLVAGAAEPAKADLVIGSTAHGSLTWPLGTIFDTDAILSDSGREFEGVLFVSSNGVPAYADLTATTIRVGFENILPDIGFASDLDFTFTFTGLTLDPGEQINGLRLLANGRNRFGTADYSTSANSITIVLHGFHVGLPYEDDDDSITYTILTKSPTIATPEPSTGIWACTAALLGLGYGWRRLKRAAGSENRDSRCNGRGGAPQIDSPSRATNSRLLETQP